MDMQGALDGRGAGDDDTAAASSERPDPVHIIGTDGDDWIGPSRTVPGQPLPTSRSDTLEGGLGDDTLDGGRGRNVLDGGQGDDVYHVGRKDTIVEVDGEGYDTVFIYRSFTLGGGVSVEKLVQSFSGVVTGNGLDNLIIGSDFSSTLNGGGGDDTIRGGDSDDLINGGRGADVMRGGAGNDAYIVDDPGDRVIDDGGLINVSIDYKMSEDFGRGKLKALGEADLALTGNKFGNEIQGNSGDNALFGRAGDDTLRGEDGDDTLDGGTGEDLFYGGLGDDVYFVDDDDSIIEREGEGYDVVYASTSFTIQFWVEELRAAPGVGDVALTGSFYDNLVVGGDGDDTLDSGGGLDTLTGGDGSDVFLVYWSQREITISDFTSGVDQIQTSIGFGFYGELPEDRLIIGPDATGDKACMVYNPKNGKLFYDWDGAGVGKKTLYAILGADVDLEASDIVLIW